MPLKSRRNIPFEAHCRFCMVIMSPTKGIGFSTDTVGVGNRVVGAGVTDFVPMTALEPVNGIRPSLSVFISETSIRAK